MMRGPAARAGRRLCAGCICAVLVVTAPGLAAPGWHAATQPAQLEPAWVTKAPGAIQWIDVSPVGDSPIVFFATEDSVFSVVSTAGGRINLAQVVRGRDLRLAQRSDALVDAGPVVVFDRYSIHGLRDESAPFAWSFRDDPGDVEAHRGDPEALPRWLDAAVCGEQVIAINSDGRVVRLDLCSGELRGRLDLGPLPVATLHVSGESGVVVAKARGRIFAAFIKPGEVLADARRVEVGGQWPAWSSLIGETLLTVDSATLRVVTGDGLLCEHTFETPRPAPTSYCRIDEARVAVLGATAARALDVTSGATLWSTPIDGLTPNTPARLRLDGGMLVVQSPDAAWLLEPACGRVVMRLADRVTFVQVVSGRVELLRESRSPPDWIAERRPLADCNAPPDAWLLRQRGAATALVRWRADTVVVGSRRSIAVYVLRPVRGR